MKNKRDLFRNFLSVALAGLMLIGVSACGTSVTPTSASSIESAVETTTKETQSTLPQVGLIGVNGFENEADLAGWIGRGESGSVTIKQSNAVAHSGTYSLITENRSIDWNGPGCTYPFEKGRTYTITSWVYQDSGSSQMIILSAEATVDGVPGYQNLNRTECKSGEWTQLMGTFRAGDNMEKAVIYFETLDAASLSFYVDDISVVDKDSVSLASNLPSLVETYKDSFDIGCAVPLSAFTDSELVGFLKSQYNTYTHENELKPESVLDMEKCKEAAAAGDETHPVLNFEKALPMLDFAKENGYKVHGHVLVWFKQTPMEFFHEGYSLDKPVVSREVMLERLENYIAGVFAFVTENYPGVITTWDVVNEAILGETGGMRRTKSEDSEEGDMWLEVVGEDYVESAFTYARKYAPKDVQLFYNDFNIPYEPKQTGIYELVKKLNDKGLIDGVGFQGHYEVENPAIQQISKAIDRFSDLGLRIRISELDIQAADNSEEVMLKQAYRYQDLLEMFKSKADVIDTVVFWGISDGTSWMAEKYPLLFDADMQPKMSFWALTDTSKLPPVVQTANAYGVSEITEDNFALATEYAFGSNSFRALYTETELTVRVFAADKSKDAEDSVTIFMPDGQVTLLREGGTETEEGYYVDIKAPMEAKNGKKLEMDILVSDKDVPTAWNDPQNADASRNFGKLTFVVMSTAAKSVFGTPDMTKSEPDAVWETAPVFNVDQTKDKLATEDGTVSVTFQSMWDEENLYVLATVVDPHLDDSLPTSYEQDSVELFIDEGNNKLGTYEDDDGQYRINFKNVLNADHGMAEIVSRTILTDTGFVVEVAIPLTSKASPKDVLGFDVRYNNIDAGAKRHLLNFSDVTDAGWKDTSVFGLLVLE